MDDMSVEQRRKTMKLIKSKDTSIELKLRKNLWHKGLRYRKNFKELPGKPDIVFIKEKIAVFCDSEFWHGKEFDLNSFIETKNAEYWKKKIKSNIDRDTAVDQELKTMGYVVLRFWGKDIISNVELCSEVVVSEILRLRKRNNL